VRTDVPISTTTLAQHVFLLLNLSLFAAQLNAVTVTDDLGMTITLKAPARRIISLAPHTTELLFAAGAGNQIVGAVRYSYYPEAAKTIPSIGDTNKLDLERIVALEPDLIIAWQSNAAADTEILRKLKIPIFVSEPVSLEAIAGSIDSLGRLAGTSDIARQASSAFLARLNSLRERYADKRVVTTFYQFWDDPIFTINGKHIISAVMQLCGGRNIFTHMPLRSAQISVEAVLSANPEVIIASAIDETRPSWLDNWRRWPELEAVRNGHLYYIPPDFIQRNTPRILEGATMLCKYLDEARTH